MEAKIFGFVLLIISLTSFNTVSAAIFRYPIRPRPQTRYWAASPSENGMLPRHLARLNGGVSFKEETSNVTNEKLEQQRLSKMFFKYFLRNLGLMSFRHLEAEKNAWIIDEMLDNIVDGMKNENENDEDQTSGTEGMKNHDEKGTKNLIKNDGFRMSSFPFSNVHKIFPRLYLK